MKTYHRTRPEHEIRKHSSLLRFVGAEEQASRRVTELWLVVARVH
jgi:hypothetical protein